MFWQEHNRNKQAGLYYALDALQHWFIINSLQKNRPLIDPILAKIYFDTYCIPCPANLDDIKELANEYEADIIRFFLTCQHMRCQATLKCLEENFKNTSIVLPIQCKPFFEEMLTMSENIKQHNIMTKETAVLDSLRDTIIGNSIKEKYSNFQRLINPEPQHVATSGGYILTDEEKLAYLGILSSAIYKHFSPLFNPKDTKGSRVYALTDIYQDSATRFERIVDYIKSALFMVCKSLDDRICVGCWAASSIVPGVQEDMYSTIKLLWHNTGMTDRIDEISKEAAKYGGLSLNHAICLPVSNTVNLNGFKLEKNAISLTYKFFVCQSVLAMMHGCCDEQSPELCGDCR